MPEVSKPNPSRSRRGQPASRAPADLASRALHVITESPIATALMSRDTKVEFWNAAAERLFGWTAEDVMGGPQSPLIPDDRRDEARGLLKRLQAGETLDGFETVRLAKNGEPIDVALYGSSLGDEIGGGYALRFVDLRERKRLERAMNEQEARRALALAEVERQQFRDHVVSEFFAAVAAADDERDIFGRLVDSAVEVVRSVCAAYRLSPDGAYLDLVSVASRDPEHFAPWVGEISSRRMRADEGSGGRAVQTGEGTLIASIPDDRRQEFRARYSPERWAAIGAREPRALMTVPLVVSGARIGHVGAARLGDDDEPFSQADFEFIQSLATRAGLAIDRARARRAEMRSLSRARILAEFVQWASEARDQHEVLRELARRAADDVQGSCSAFLLDATGIQLELAVLATTDPRIDAGLRAMLTTRPWRPGEGIMGEALRTGQTVWRPYMSESGRVAYLAALPDDRRAEMAELDLRAIMTVPLSVEGRIIGVLAIARWGESAAPFNEADRTFAEQVAGRASQALARIDLEGELRRTSELLTTILDASPVAIMAVDENRKLTYWNRAAEEVYGWTAAEVLGSPPPFDPPGDPGFLEGVFARIRDGEMVAEETQRRRKTGETLEVRVRDAPIYDESGVFRGGLGMHEDITSRKRLETELFQAQKMETVGQLAGGVAHDFNNILTAIIGYADLARAVATEDEVQSALTTIRNSAERAAGLTRQLLAFSRRQMLQPEVVDPNEVLLGMEQMLRRIIGEHIELAISVTPEIGCILVDRTQLEQVVLNLAVNARDAMPEGGRLVVQTESERFEGERLRPGMDAGDYVSIHVSDTGTGMDEETIAYIFEPFFTTKEVGKGTGLGLATTYGIVRQSGGFIDVDSTPGAGTTFSLYFPRAGERQPHEPEPAAPRRGRGLPILLVEDEPVIRDLAAAVLERHGYRVVQASSPRAALVLMADPSERIELVVTDVVMPGMNGLELVRRLRATRPSLKALFVSGYAPEQTTTGRSFLAKPFTPEALLRAVDEALASGRPETAMDYRAGSAFPRR